MGRIPTYTIGGGQGKIGGFTGDLFQFYSVSVGETRVLRKKKLFGGRRKRAQELCINEVIIGGKERKIYFRRRFFPLMQKRGTYPWPEKKGRSF